MTHSHDTSPTPPSRPRHSGQLPAEFERAFREGQARGIAVAALVCFGILGIVMVCLMVALITSFSP
jgi:hypothetical protein